IRIRQRPKQNAVNRAEDRRVCTNADRKRQNRDRSEASVLCQRSNREPQILRKKTHGPSFDITTHSYLSATIGSTREDLRAGMKHATRATPSNINATKTNVRGSVALTPNNKLSISRVNPYADNTPTDTPPSEIFSPPLTTSPTTSRACAPSAIRNPISCVR